MSGVVKIVECPRDAWQSLPVTIPAEVKADYLRKLAASGFNHIDAVSFVSATAVPQMADSERVLEILGPLEGVELIGIVVNAKGAQRAINSGLVQTLGFPYSISSQFLQQNQRQTPEEALEVLGSISNLARQARMDLVVYISMAFGNPYGEPWSIARVTEACHVLTSSGVRQISLADTVGIAQPSRIAETIAAVLDTYSDIEVGVHLHAQPRQAAEKIRAAYLSGCRRFDAAFGGLGGCPFAQDVLVGNVATETLIDVLNEQGAHMPRFGPLQQILQTSAEIAERNGTRPV